MSLMQDRVVLLVLLACVLALPLSLFLVLAVLRRAKASLAVCVLALVLWAAFVAGMFLGYNTGYQEAARIHIEAFRLFKETQ
jgi:hypothetical protein